MGPAFKAETRWRSDYNPENPQDALLDSFNFTYSIPFFFTVFGGIMLTFGIVQRLKIKQRPKLP